jgi:hypothetical protein
MQYAPISMSIFSSHQHHHHHHYHQPAILYYDYILTLDEEIIFFWKRKINLVTALFFLNRYFGLFGNAAVILQSFRSWSPAVGIS